MGRRAALIAMIPALIWAGAGWAEGPQPFPDFTFKRIGPPPADSPRRITVQIDPNASLPPAPAPRSPTADIPTDLPGASGYEWFWAQVPPGAAARPASAAFSRPVVGVFIAGDTCAQNHS